jgi:rubrerythrin
MGTTNPSPTHRNLEAAFAGESMAHIKYLHFARIAREHGDLAAAEVFEETAEQEVLHALGHADLLYPPKTLSTNDVLDLAIAGETYEYTEMYPGFRRQAEAEGDAAAAQEIDQQIAESRDHAARFRATLDLARKRFAALAKVEERHAARYRSLRAGRG